jgi:hypothetical protein
VYIVLQLATIIYFNVKICDLTFKFCSSSDADIYLDVYYAMFSIHFLTILCRWCHYLECRLIVLDLVIMGALVI